MDLQRFAFSTQAFSRHSLDHALKQISAAGFRGVEVLADKPHVWLESLDSESIAKLKSDLARLNLAVSNINANFASGYWNDAPPEPLFEPSLISRNRALREWRIAYTKKALRLGKELNAACVSVTSGRALNGVPPEEGQKLLVEGLKRLLEYAEKLGQRLALKVEPTLQIERTDELADLIKKLKSKFFGAVVDVSCADASGENPVQAIRKLKGAVFGVQLADIRAHKLYPRLPGDGDLNFNAIFRALDESGYSGPLTWNLHASHPEPDFACGKTFRFVKSVSKSAAVGTR